MEDIKNVIAGLEARKTELQSELATIEGQLKDFKARLREAEEAAIAPKIGQTRFYTRSSAAWGNADVVVRITEVTGRFPYIARGEVIAVINGQGVDVGEVLSMDEAYIGSIAEEGETDPIPAKKVWKEKQ